MIKELIKSTRKKVILRFLGVVGGDVECERRHKHEANRRVEHSIYIFVLLSARHTHPLHLKKT
jgi:hypothetical protein